jgi:pimeloyl-ACP methyl ester carboxylesterase
VVFENGFGGALENWGKVQPAVSRFARTVSYDRPGSGLSTGPPLRGGHRIADELRGALQGANIAPPYILVGASMGGRYIRIFAGAYPEDVAGMVLVDPTPDNERVDETLEQARTSRVPGGVPVILIDAVSPLELPFASEGVRALRMRNRWELEAESVEHRKWIDTVPGGRLIVTNRSGHNVFLEQPELVVDTIRRAIGEATRLHR